jgi:HD-GYP domain
MGDGIPSQCDAIVIPADLRRANNVAILRETSEVFKRAHRRGLGAASISDLVRILTIFFAALIEDRRYRPPMPRAQAYQILSGMRGKLEMPLVSALKDVALNH